MVSGQEFLEKLLIHCFGEEFFSILLEMLKLTPKFLCEAPLDRLLFNIFPMQANDMIMDSWVSNIYHPVYN
jgi:hypothetical protein